MYAQFREEEHAAAALQNLSGRFYAGIEMFISVLFSSHTQIHALILVKTFFTFRSSDYCGFLTSDRFP